MSDWTVYEKRVGRGMSRLVLRGSAQRPRGWMTVGPARPDEIAAALAEEQAAQASKQAHYVFQNRPEVKDADRVRAAIEIDVERIIDRLTPEEWKALADRLAD